MSARGPLRAIVADICDAAPESLLRAALRHALAQHGDYTSSDPARLLARIIEDGFAGLRPKAEQIASVTCAVAGARILAHDRAVAETTTNDTPIRIHDVSEEETLP